MHKTTNQQLIFKIAFMGIFAALAVVLATLIHFPIFPFYGFLEYDAADIPIYICTILFGPISGIILTVLVSLIQGLTVSSASGIYGIIMHIIATGTFVSVLGFVFPKRKTIPFYILKTILAILATSLIMLPANILITPLFMAVPVDAVKDMLLFPILPFNLIKQSVNGIAAIIIYKPLLLLIGKTNRE